MDDPWGSPWADEIPHDTPIISVRKEQQHDAPKTPVEAVKVEENGKLDAWGEEDDGFGEWASMPVDEGTVGGKLGFNGANDSWETRHSEEEEGLSETHTNGHAKHWGDSATIHGEDVPRLAPSLLPEAPEISRQPSPDPWSTEPSLNIEAHKENPTDGELEAYGVKSDITLVTDIQEDALPSPVLTTAVKEALQETQSIEPETPITSDALAENSFSKEAMDAQENHDDLEEVKNNKEPEIDHESSRPSSSPSDHEEILLESPRTSLDEEPKRPSMPRKVSSKVQELVEHFDTLAKAGVVEEKEPLGREASSTKGDDAVADAEEGDDFDDDFGDFEDGNSETGDPEADQPVSSELTPETHATETNIPDSASLEASPASSPPRAIVKRDFGRVIFAADISAVEKLYPDLEEETPEMIFIPDVVPHDSFSTVEERKTWYRISRYGTMQKYNTGDDENYVRVSWAQSQVRTETLKIVARWMEEDRMSGRVVLGGGSKGGSIFGWNDPNATPVPLAAAFAAKPGKKKFPTQAPAEVQPEIPREWPKGLVRSRSSSKTRSPPKPRRRTSSKSKRNSEEVKTAPQPVASFGWNTNEQESRPQVTIPLGPKVEIPPSKKPSPPGQISAAKAAALSPIFSPMFPPSQTPSASFNGLDMLIKPTLNPEPVPAPAVPVTSSEDDDWGEMISSPTNNVLPTLPPFIGLRHKKSQSLTGSFSAPLQPSPTTNTQLPSSPSGPGHRPTASLDDLLVPGPRTSATQDTISTSMDIFDAVITSSPLNAPPQPPVTAASVTSGIADPWATADFSFFDTPSLATSGPPPKLAPTPKTIPKTMTAKPATFPAPPLIAAVRGNGKSKAELEQDKIVASIVNNLPDLSYMLRK